MICSRIAGTGGYLPEKIMTNDDLAQIVDTSDQWITERTGIRQRHIAAPEESACDMAEQASRKAMDSAGVSADDLDLIIVATTTPDRVFPSTACLLQNRLGNRGAAAFDIQAVCSGFVYALSVADQMIRSGGYKQALVVGSETLSRIINWQDRSTCVLFGDGAGAVVLSATSEPGIISSHLHADGRYHELLQVPCGISERPGQLLQGEAKIMMQGNEVFKVAVKTLESIVDETLAANGLHKKDIDWLVPHQANIRIIQATAKKLKMPMDHVVVTVDKHGNTSSASVPLALDVAVREGRIKRGERLLLEAFGGGFTWGSVLLVY